MGMMDMVVGCVGCVGCSVMTCDAERSVHGCVLADVKSVLRSPSPVSVLDCI